jgi:hypothetical protein
MLMKNKITSILVLICFWTFISCSKNKEERTLLYEQERIIYDSLYNAALETTKADIDSLCKFQREDLFQRAVDSIYELRLEEIENLLDNEQ